MQYGLLDEIEIGVDNEFPPLEEFEEDMALRKEIKDEIIQAVQAAVAESLSELKPHGWRKMIFFLREWSLIGINITVILSLVGLVIAACGLWATAHSAATSRAVADNTFETNTTNHFTTIDGQLKQIQGSLSSLQLSSLSNHPVTQDTVTTVKRIVANATNASTPLDASVVTETGKQFIDATQRSPEAWPAVQSLLDYKSLVFVHPPQLSMEVYSQTAPPRETIWYVWPPGFTGEKLWSGYHKSSDIAELRKLGTPDPNLALGRGNAFMTLRGSTVVLDGMRMKHVIIENALVRYSGAPASLEDVYFVNCTFDIQPKQTGQLLATAIFSDSAVKFSS